MNCVRGHSSNFKYNRNVAIIKIVQLGRQYNKWCVSTLHTGNRAYFLIAGVL